MSRLLAWCLVLFYLVAICSATSAGKRTTEEEEVDDDSTTTSVQDIGEWKAEYSLLTSGGDCDTATPPPPASFAVQLFCDGTLSFTDDDVFGTNFAGVQTCGEEDCFSFTAASSSDAELQGRFSGQFALLVLSSSSGGDKVCHLVYTTEEAASCPVPENEDDDDDENDGDDEEQQGGEEEDGVEAEDGDEEEVQPAGKRQTETETETETEPEDGETEIDSNDDDEEDSSNEDDDDGPELIDGPAAPKVFTTWSVSCGETDEAYSITLINNCDGTFYTDQYDGIITCLGEEEDDGEYEEETSEEEDSEANVEGEISEREDSGLALDGSAYGSEEEQSQDEEEVEDSESEDEGSDDNDGCLQFTTSEGCTTGLSGRLMYHFCPATNCYAFLASETELGAECLQESDYAAAERSLPALFMLFAL